MPRQNFFNDKGQVIDTDNRESVQTTKTTGRQHFFEREKPQERGETTSIMRQKQGQVVIPEGYPRISAAPEEEKKPYSFWTKVEKAVLPKSLETYFGVRTDLDKVSTSEIMKQNESARQSYYREKRKGESIAELGNIPLEEYTPPTKFTGKLSEALEVKPKVNYIVKGYFTPAIGTIAEQFGIEAHNRTIREWGEKFADQTLYKASRTAQVQSMQDVPGLFEGGLKDPRTYSNLISQAIGFFGAVLGSSALVTAITRSPSAGVATAFSVGASIEGTNVYQDMIRSGLAPDEANTAAEIYGVIASIIENTTGLKPAFGVKQMTKDFAKRAAKDKGYKAFLKTWAEEGILEEGSQQLVENLVVRTIDNDRKLTEDVAESMVGGMIGALPLVGATHIYSNATKPKTKEKKEEIKGEVKTEEEITEETKPEPVEISAARDILINGKGNVDLNPNLITTLENKVNQYHKDMAIPVIDILDTDQSTLAQIRVVQYPDGRWGSAYEINTAENGILSDFLSNKITDTRAEAVKSAKEAMLEYAENEVDNVSEEVKPDFQGIIEQIKKVNPELDVPVEVRKEKREVEEEEIKIPEEEEKPKEEKKEKPQEKVKLETSALELNINDELKKEFVEILQKNKEIGNKIKPYDYIINEDNNIELYHSVTSRKVGEINSETFEITEGDKEKLQPILDTLIKESKLKLLDLEKDKYITAGKLEEIEKLEAEIKGEKGKKEEEKETTKEPEKKPETEEALIQKAKESDSVEKFIESQVKITDSIRHLDPDRYGDLTGFIRDIEKLNDGTQPVKEIKIGEKLWGNKPEQIIENINPNSVKLAEEPLRVLPKAGKEVTEPIIIEMIDGVPVLVDGRHRLAQAIANNQPTIKAKISGKSQISRLTDIWNKEHKEEEKPEVEEKEEPRFTKPEEKENPAVVLLKKQIGDIFDVVEPVGNLWVSKKNTIFIKLKKHRMGFIEKLRQSNFIENAQEAGGNNVIKVVVKPELLKAEKPKVEEKETRISEEKKLVEFKNAIEKSEPIIRNVKLAEEMPERKMTLKNIGNVGDYIIQPRLRETIKNALDVPIYVYKGTPTIQEYPEAAYRGIFSPNALLDENYDLVDAILINEEKAQDFEDLRTIYHEAVHGQRYAKNKDFDFSTAYEKRTFELSAKRAEDFYLQVTKGMTPKETEEEKPKPRFAKPKVKKKAGKVLPAHEVAAKIIDKRPNLPILREFKVEDGKLTATDLDMAITLNSELSDGMYKMVGKDAVKTDTDPKEFPIMPKGQGDLIFTASSEDLQQTINEANLSKSKNDNRQELNSVLFKIEDNQLIVASTDSYRLYMKTMPSKIKGEGEFMISNTNKLQKVITALGEDVEMFFEKPDDQPSGYVNFVGKNGSAIIRTTEGQYPDIKEVIPSYKKRYSFGKSEMLSALKELKPYLKEMKEEGVAIDIEGNKMTLSSSEIDEENNNMKKELVVDIHESKDVNTAEKAYNDGVIVMPIKYENRLAFNIDYLIDALNSLPDDALYFYTTGIQNTPSFFSNDSDLQKAKPKPRFAKQTTSGGGIGLARPAMKDNPLGLETRGLGSNPFVYKWKVKMPLVKTTEETINKTEIITWVEKAFGVPIRGKVTHKWKNAGMYYPEKWLIRLQKWGELPVIAHEVSHHIDFRFRDSLGRNWYRPTKAIVTELADLDYDQKQRRTEEGFAEYMRYRLTTDEAQSKAPEFDKFFNNFLNEHAELKENLDELKRKIDIWFSQGAENRVIQHIDWKGEHTNIGGAKEKINKAIAIIQKQFNDEFYVPQKITGEIERILGRELPPTKNPAKMLEYSKSKAGAIARTFVMDKAIDEHGNVVGKGLHEVLSPIDKDDIQKFVAYGVSKRALNLENRGIESGFNIDDAKFVIERYKNKGWDNAVDELTEWSNNALDWIIRAGGLDEASAEAMRKLNPIYLPFKRAFLDNVQVFKKEAGGGYVDTGTGIKRIKGSGRPIINPIESMISQLTPMFAKAQKIQIASLFADLAEEEGLGGYVTEVPAPMQATKFNANQIADYIDRQVRVSDPSLASMSKGDYDDVLTVFTQGSRYTGKDNVVTIFRNGKQRFYEIHPDLYEALKGVDPLKLGPVLKIFSPFARILRLGATGLKVSFGLARNPFRDALSYVVFSKRNRITPLDPARGFYTNITAKEGEPTWRFKKLGGALSGQIGLDRSATRNVYDEMLVKNLGKKGKTLYLIRHPIGALSDIISLTEMGPRSAEMEGAYKKYMSKEWRDSHQDWTDEDAFVQAFLDAQDVTINFTKSGRLGKQINQVTAFFNVAIRGPEKLYRSFKERPAATTIKGLAWLTISALLSWYKNKDKEWYKNLEPSYKYNNLFYEINGNVFRLPIPFELGTIFMSIPQSVMDTYKNKDTEAIMGILSNLKAQIPDPTPSVFGPALDVAKNKNWLGNPIESKGMQYKYPTERYYDWTSGLAKSLSKIVDKSGVKLSPVQIDYLINNYTGGFLKQFEVGDETYDLPVLSDLMVRDPLYPKRQLNNFFDDYTVLSQKVSSEMANENENNEYNKIASEDEINKYHELLMFYDFYKSVQLDIVDAKAEKDTERVNELYREIVDELKFYGYD